MAISNIKNQLSWTPLLISALMCIALTGCNPGERKEAKALAKATEDASKAYDDYESSVVDDYQRIVVTRNVLRHVPYEPVDRQMHAKVIHELQARAALAKQLHTMASEANGVLNFSADDAKAAARDLADKIAAVNNHAFSLPAPISQFLPADKQDPNDYLDDAVKALVQVEALRNYKQALPKIREAVVDVELFFEAD